MAEGLLGGILGEEDEKAEVEARGAPLGAEAFASAVAAKLAPPHTTRGASHWRATAISQAP